MLLIPTYWFYIQQPCHIHLLVLVVLGQSLGFSICVNIPYANDDKLNFFFQICRHSQESGGGSKANLGYIVNLSLSCCIIRGIPQYIKTDNK